MVCVESNYSTPSPLTRKKFAKCSSRSEYEYHHRVKLAIDLSICYLWVLSFISSFSTFRLMIGIDATVISPTFNCIEYRTLNRVSVLEEIHFIERFHIGWSKIVVKIDADDLGEPFVQCRFLIFRPWELGNKQEYM